MAITTYDEFLAYCPKDGEIADENVLGKPSQQLKKELDTVIAQVNSILGIKDPLEWDADTNYSENEIVKYQGIVYVSLEDNNKGNQPDVSATKWQKISGGSLSISRDVVVPASGFSVAVSTITNPLTMKPARLFLNGILIPFKNYTYTDQTKTITLINGFVAYKNDILTIEY
ncbi:putative adaptor protein [Campylobacter phage F341]|nr:putative adaptor protein [Campylobacter phage F341]